MVSVAALDSDHVVAEFTGHDTHRHAEDLVPAVRTVLEQAGWEHPEIVVTGEGPGPFTGLRVGMATAATLAFAWDVPVTGLCSLDGLARTVAGRAGTGHGFVAALDARRKELYWARYGADAERVDGPHVGSVADLPEGCPVAGAGAAARATELIAAGVDVVPGTEELPVSAADLGAAWLAAGAPVVTPTARYLRESDAVVPASMRGVDVSSGRERS